MNGTLSKTTDLDVVLNDVNEESALALRNIFMPYFQQADLIARQANGLVVTSIEQKSDIAKARDWRLKLKNIRVETEKARKARKEGVVREGKAIDGMANIIKYLIVPVEQHLQAQEDFVKLEEQRRKDALQEDRESDLYEYEVEVEHYNLAEMSEEGFQNLLETSKLIYEQRKDAEIKAEQERIAREKADAEARQKMQEENKRLKSEAEAREKQAKIEKEKQAKIEAQRIAKEQKERKARLAADKKVRKEQQAALQKEREAREKIEAELRLKHEEELKAKQQAEAEYRKARLAPDKKKIEALAIQITSLEMPEVTSKEAKLIIAHAIELLNKTSNYIKEKSIDL